MKMILKINDYDSAEVSILEWDEGYSINAKNLGDEFVIEANAAGLITFVKS